MGRRLVVEVTLAISAEGIVYPANWILMCRNRKFLVMERMREKDRGKTWRESASA